MKAESRKNRLVFVLGSIGAWLRLDLIKPNEIVFVERKFLLADQLKARLLYLLENNFLACPNVVQHPFPAFAFDPVKINHDDLPTRPEGFVDRSHRLERKLEVVVGIANKGQ